MFWNILGDILLLALLISAKPKEVCLQKKSHVNADMWNQASLGFLNHTCIYNLNLQFGHGERKKEKKRRISIKAGRL